jgi:hypothetical protein
LPKERELAFGCDSANNDIFFICNDQEISGIKVAENALDLVAANLKSGSH